MKKYLIIITLIFLSACAKIEVKPDEVKRIEKSTDPTCLCIPDDGGDEFGND